MMSAERISPALIIIGKHMERFDDGVLRGTCSKGAGRCTAWGDSFKDCLSPPGPSAPFGGVFILLLLCVFVSALN